MRYQFFLKKTRNGFFKHSEELGLATTDFFYLISIARMVSPAFSA